MPPLGAAVGAAVAKWAAGITIGKILTSVATSLILSGLQRLITPKPKGQGQAIQNTGITQQVRQPIIVRKPVYGEVRRSGGVLFIGTTSNNRYLHIVIEVAPHEIEEIGEVWLNDYSIPADHLDGSGVVNTGRYNGKVRIKKHLGTAAQTADSDLVSEVTEWTTNHRLRGIAYVYIRLDWDQDIFPTGVPNVSAWIRGKKIYDPRTTTTYYSNNIALMLNDYLLDTTYGLGITSGDIEQTFLTAAANTCDEFVTTTNYDETVSSVDASGDTLSLDTDTLFFQRGDRVRVLTTGTTPAGLSTGTDYYVIPYQRVKVDSVDPRVMLATTYANSLAGTQIDITDAGTGTHTIRKTAEPRYTGAAVIDTELEVGENIKDLLSGMSGNVTYSGGVFRMFAGAYQTPSVTFTEDNIRSSISVQTKLSRRERFNSVRGVYTSPINNGEPTDYPEITNSTYVTEDQRKIVKQIDMPVTQRPHTCQRIAKVNLELARQEITWSALFDMSALQVVAGDNAYFTIDRFGWSSKVFQIKSWSWVTESENGVIIPLIRMEMREIASANYDWSNGEETAVDPAPNTDLPDVFTVDPPTGLGVAPIEVPTASGDLTYEFLASWTAPSNLFVTNGGYYEVEFKKSTDTDWDRYFRAEGGDTTIRVKQVQPGINYDLRIRSVNTLGVRSSYQQLLGFNVTSPSGATIRVDYGMITGGVTDTFDYGAITGSNDATNDFGDVV